jgi:hypothetical protein
MARTNHKNLHKKLDEMGYNVYVCDYSYGMHHYQFEKKEGGGFWNEYSVDTKKKIIDASVEPETLPLIKEYYEAQGYTVI